MVGLDPSNAIFEDDKSIDGMMLGTGNFLTRTAPAVYDATRAATPIEEDDNEDLVEAPPPAPPLASEDEPLSDLTGRPLIPPPKGPKSVWDHLQDNLADVRAEHRQKTVWERMVEQSKGK